MLSAWLDARVHARRESLLADAAGFRRVREARRRGCDSVGRQRRAATRDVALRDGAQVLIRPITAADAPLLADAFARMSPESRRARFMTGKDALSASELRYFTVVDHHDHEALCAVSRIDGRGVGAARYIRSEADPHTAEVSLTVIDDWQHRGLGTELLALLMGNARRAGIRRVTAFVAADNTAALGLLRSLRTEARVVRRERDMVEYELALAS